MFGAASNSPSQDAAPLFESVFFLLSGFDPPTQSQLSEALEQHGGVSVGEYSASCTHVIVPRSFLWDDPVCAAARKDGKCLCSEIWVSDCLDLGVIVDVNHVVYRPLRDPEGIPGTKKLVVCLTGYQGPARRNVMRMVYMMGAQFSKPLVANRITHLVCYKYEGEKFNLAKQLRLKLVNHQWLEDCLRTWALLSEEDYTKSGYDVELAEAEAKDSEDDGNLKSTSFKTQVPPGEVIPCISGAREEITVQEKIVEVNVEHPLRDERRDDHHFSNLISPQKHENTPRKVNVTSSAGELQNVVSRDEFVSEMQDDGRDAYLKSPNTKTTRSPGVSRSCKGQTTGMDTDDNSSLLRHDGGPPAEDQFIGIGLMEGQDLGSSCKSEKVSKFTTPAMDGGKSVNLELALKSPGINRDEKSTTTPIPQETPCPVVSCELPSNIPVGVSTVTKRKHRLSVMNDVKVSKTKKQGKQTKKSDSIGTVEKRILTAEQMVLVKKNVVEIKITGHSEVATSPNRLNSGGITEDNGGPRQSGEMHAADESVCILELEGHDSGSLRKAKVVVKGPTPTKNDGKTTDLELAMGSPGLNKNEKAEKGPIAHEINSNIVSVEVQHPPIEAVPVGASTASEGKRSRSSEVQNLPLEALPVSARAMGKGKGNRSEKADAKIPGTEKQGKQSKSPKLISTLRKRIPTAEKMCSDKENVVCQSHDPKSEGKVLQQEAPVAKKPQEVVVSQVNMSLEAKVASQRCFALSGHRQEIKPLQALVKKLGGKLCRESHQWSHQTTHLVVAGQLRRTEKLFAAAAAGRWILQDDYLRDSSEAGVFLDEKKYEWHGAGMTKDGAISFEAPRKWREQRENTGCCALEGLHILLYGECIIPSLDTLRRALRAGGADLVATCPPYTKFLASKIDFAIVNPGTPRNDNWIREFLSHNIACVTTDFFVDFVCKPTSSLDRHILYDTNSLVEAAVAHMQATNASVKRGRQESIEDGDGEGGGEDICCVACGQSDREDVMLLCGDDKGSGCGTAMHIDCCKPSLDKVPAHDWYCVQCTKPSSSLKRKKKRRAVLKS